MNLYAGNPYKVPLQIAEYVETLARSGVLSSGDRTQVFDKAGKARANFAQWEREHGNL